jgi:hypothetical protein
MAPVATAVASARVVAPQQNRRTRELDHAKYPQFGATQVRKARPEDIGPLLRLAEALMESELAKEETVLRVVDWRPDSLWTFSRENRVVGGIAMLMLNSEGLNTLLAGTMDMHDPEVRFLANCFETPAGIYLWGLAHLSASDAVLKMLVRLRSPPYASINLYAVPFTLSGLRFQQRWGFQPIPGHPRHLSQYVRLANRPH